MFEVERFEWAADDRLELEGRWFGLRGRRFVRPTLEVEVDGEARRLLALMEHKPWQALDGEDWVAAFKWDGEPGELSAELAVGADLTFELPAPNGKTPRKKSRAKSNGSATVPKPAAAKTAVVKPSANARVSRTVERRMAAAELARDEAISDARALRRAVDQKDRTVRDLREQIATARAEAEAARTEAEAARAEAAAVSQSAPDEDEDAAALAQVLERVRQELRAAREEAAAADAAPSPDAERLAQELERVRAELLAARAETPPGEAELVELRQQLEAAIAARQAAIEHVKEAERQRHDAVAALADAGRESGGFAREIQRVQAERDELRTTARTARQERDAAVRERDALREQLESTKRERDTAQLARDAVRAERPQVAGVAEVIRKRGPRAFALLSAERSDDEILALRFVAFVALSVVCLLVAIWIIAF